MAKAGSGVQLKVNICWFPEPCIDKVELAKTGTSNRFVTMEKLAVESGLLMPIVNTPVMPGVMLNCPSASK